MEDNTGMAGVSKIGWPTHDSPGHVVRAWRCMYVIPLWPMVALIALIYKADGPCVFSPEAWPSGPTGGHLDRRLGGLGVRRWRKGNPSARGVFFLSRLRRRFQGSES
ncbi:hypothetical protein B296_00009267 [Ensete ventricosum]|uniref:Uncharacterized protein n=1 Tax=Ensete ventricosum TaxID=4639 RepID=A0A427AM04_ENSVE|nr:hypothetical protein B296_00009267 [Ensete ventricosum]